MWIRKSLWLFTLASLCAAGASAADAKPALVFSHKIGQDWPYEQPNWMNFVAISADGKTVASNGRLPEGHSGPIGLWSFPEGKFIRAVDVFVSAISPDFSLIVADKGLLELSSGKPVARFAGGSPAAFSPDGKYLAFNPPKPEGKAHVPSIRVIRTADGALVSQFGTRYTRALAVQPGNQVVASGHWDNVTLWNLSTGERLALLAGFERYVYGVAFSQDGRYLAAGTDDGSLQIWDVAARRRLHALRIGYSDVSNPAFSPDGKLVAAGTYADGTLSLVDVASGAIVSQIQVSMFGCGSVAFSPDGQFLVTPSNGGLLNSGRNDLGGSIRVFQVAR
jgi:WD40 repeat protein